jgi:class 3 adenylate cyclase
MRRRKQGSNATKTQRPKALKRRDPRRTTRHRASATRRELDEVRAQQAATAEILRAIRTSPTDIGSVFETIVRNAVSLCSSLFANVFRFDGNQLHFVASHNVGPNFMELLQAKYPMRPDSSQVSGRVMLTKSVIRIEDVLSDPDYDKRFPRRMAFRRMLGIPMLREGDPIGVIVVGWVQAAPVVKAQEELLKTFADQAVIAIENARLLKELRERTDELETQSQEVAKLNQQLERRVADQVGEIERMSRLRRFLPPQVVDLIIASGTEKRLESHRREITALYCDLRGFTGFSESSDPEDVMLLLREYHAALGEIIIKYSGTLEHYAGDGVMVFFNDPIPVPNPALQAVHAALDMRTAIGSLTEKWRRLGHELGFGVGIAHGFATLGIIGFEGRFDYAAIGTVSNVASRLCDEAKPGQILISPRVLMAVEDAVTVEPGGDFTLKGISRPLAAYNVLSAVSAKI